MSLTMDKFKQKLNTLKQSVESLIKPKPSPIIKINLEDEEECELVHVFLDGTSGQGETFQLPDPDPENPANHVTVLSRDRLRKPDLHLPRMFKGSSIRGMVTVQSPLHLRTDDHSGSGIHTDPSVMGDIFELTDVSVFVLGEFICPSMLSDRDSHLIFSRSHSCTNGRSKLLSVDYPMLTFPFVFNDCEFESESFVGKLFTVRYSVKCVATYRYISSQNNPTQVPNSTLPTRQASTSLSPDTITIPKSNAKIQKCESEVKMFHVELMQRKVYIQGHLSKVFQKKIDRKRASILSREKRRMQKEIENERRQQRKKSKEDENDEGDDYDDSGNMDLSSESQSSEKKEQSNHDNSQKDMEDEEQTEEQKEQTKEEEKSDKDSEGSEKMNQSSLDMLIEEVNYNVDNLIKSVDMSVGVEGCLHIEFHYNNIVLDISQLSTCLEGSVRIIMNTLIIKEMQIQILRREIVNVNKFGGKSTVTFQHGKNNNNNNDGNLIGSSGLSKLLKQRTVSHKPELHDTVVLVTQQIMDGSAVNGEVIPLRVFVNEERFPGLGCSMGSISQQQYSDHFTVKYYANLGLIDHEGRRYFKTCELFLYKSK